VKEVEWRRLEEDNEFWEPDRLAGKRRGFGGEQVERSCMEVWNRMWQMRTELN